MKSFAKLSIMAFQAILALGMTACASTDLASDQDKRASAENEMITGSNFLKKSGKNPNNGVVEVDKHAIMDSMKNNQIIPNRGAGGGG